MTSTATATISLTSRISPDLYTVIGELAQQQGTSKVLVVRAAIAEYAERHRAADAEHDTEHCRGQLAIGDAPAR